MALINESIIHALCSFVDFTINIFHSHSGFVLVGEPRKIPGVYSWKDWLATGASLPEATLDARMAAQRPGECCTLIYTSGTTGNPKAVMLSHDNITWTSAASSGLADICADDSIVSYLPMSHIAAQLTDLMSPLLVGMEVSFARPDALKGSLVETLQQVRPTVMMGVPRVWEKIEEKMRAVGAANTGIKKAVGDWAKSIGVAGSKAKLKGEPLPWGWTLANAVVFSNVKKALGLDRCRLRATGAAPITMKTMEYFMSLDLTLFELYGMSESTGPHSMNHPEVGYTKMGSVGQTMPGVETKIDRPDAKGEGEICMRGRHIFMGYMKNEDATKKDIDSEGWLHTGDIGRMDEKGFINITGRIKELIITAGGENIPPVLIEETLKAKAPAISNAMLIGDKRKFLTCLVSLKTEPDAEGNPTNKLFGPALELAKSVKSKARTVEEAVQDPKIIAAIQHAVDKANKLATSRAQRISKWTFITTDFSIAGGELTPTMKLKRRVVAAMYSDVIEAFYADDATAPLPSKL